MGRPVCGFALRFRDRFGSRPWRPLLRANISLRQRVCSAKRWRGLVRKAPGVEQHDRLALTRRWTRFPFSVTTVVGEKPHEHYWWEQHAQTRAYLAPAGLSGASQGTSGRIADKLPRRDSRMKRLTLLLLGLALGVSATANAQGLTMQMSNGWAFTFAGNVNVFWSFTKENTNAGDAANSNIRTGLLPTFATFEAKGKEAGLTLGIHFGFAPQIQNVANLHDEFTEFSRIDMRQVYLTVGFKDGSQILAGRELGLFERQAILNDMTLFGVGAVGLSFGIFQPSNLGGPPATYAFTTIPRVEAEFSYNQKSGKNNYMVWVGGLWQTTKNAPTGGTSITSFGGNAGVKGSFSDLTVVVTGYIGKALGTTLMFSGDEIAADGTTGRPSDGGYVQLMYKVGPKTNVGASWGFSRLKDDQTGDGDADVRSNMYAYTVGIYHQWTKSLKLVFEGTQEGTTGESAGPFFSGFAPGSKQTDVSAGLMLFF